MTQHNTPDNSRRSFWKNMSTSWARALKSAQSTEDFPFNFNGLAYNCRKVEHADETVLVLPGFPALTLTKSNVYQLKNFPEKNSVLSDFIAEKTITALFTPEAVPQIPPVKQVIYAPDKDNLQGHIQTKSPCLLLFESDDVHDHVHHLPQMLARMPAGSDIYIGNVARDLKSPSPSSTWERIQLFLDETQISS